MKSEWYTVIDDDRGTLQLEFNRGMAFLHTTFKRPLAAMRSASTALESVLAVLRNIGYQNVHVIIPDNDEKLYRFETRFGFKEIRRHGGNILMSRGC